MAYLIVLVVSLLVGAGAYLATMRAAGERPAAVGFDGGSSIGEDDLPTEGGLVPAGAGYTYLRVGTRGPTWQDRAQGALGLIVLLVAGAITLAYGIYQVGHLINLTIERFLQD
jgi:hypothetical protein